MTGSRSSGVHHAAGAAATAVATLLLTAGTLAWACTPSTGPPEPPPSPDPTAVERLQPTVLDELAHDIGAFTQGFEISGDSLYEGTGLSGRSELRELDPVTGALRTSVPLPRDLFGEGITVVDDRIWQLTWQDGVALEWDRSTFTLLREVPFAGEGWGLCFDGSRLIRSDGTDVLTFHDPATFDVTGSVTVTLPGTPVTNLNELECVDGQVWANVWQTDQILRIDPTTGRVTATVDAGGLLDPERATGADVLNGIAAAGTDASGRATFLLTGKLWPATFRVVLLPVEPVS